MELFDTLLTRRGAIGAGLAASLPVSAQQAPPKIGLIGCGLRSRAHFAALKELPEARVAALSDVESARMAEVNKTLPEKAAAYTDYRELLRDKNVGAVVIVTPGYLHHEMALAALRAGKDLILEKPLAFTWAQAREIEREAIRGGRIVAVCMQRHYGKPDAETRRAVQSGIIGDIRLITCVEFRGDWNANTWKYTDPQTGKKTSWRLLAKTSGSSELEFAIHAFAEVCELVKSPVMRVAASGGVVHYKDRDTRDVSTVLADFASGARFNYSFSCFATGGGNTLTILGDKGVLSRAQGKLTLHAGRRAEEIKPSPDIPAESMEVQFYREFFRNVRERTPSPLSPTVALEPCKIAFGADISIAQNRIVTAKDFA